MKRKLGTIFLILIILLSVVSIKAPANAFEDSQEAFITQGEIKSKQYLVTDEYISRISPKTGVKSFVMQLGLENKEIAIYEDKNKDIEVTEGLISTGMIMTVKNPKTEGNVGEETGELEEALEVTENEDGSALCSLTGIYLIDVGNIAFGQVSKENLSTYIGEDQTFTLVLKDNVVTTHDLPELLDIYKE